ncbi:MAG: DUF2798 domain-containing protein [Blastomonas fulva]|uniref:DUF2798 domain-containing protein n=1 Tax=Blastomonas fulva TaxID=1550728 RepID=UPI0040337C6B
MIDAGLPKCEGHWRMNTKMKQKVAFALVMGMLTTGIISFSLIAINLGFSKRFLGSWLQAWVTAYVIVIPIILVVSPRLQAHIDRIIK